MNENTFSAYQPYIFLVIGLLLLGLAIFFKSKKALLKQTGVPADAIIFERGLSGATSARSANTDELTVRFVTEKQEWITEKVKQDFQLFYTEQYKLGETVKVFYDKDDPSNFYLDTKQSELKAKIIVVGVGVLFIGYGLYKLIS